MTHTGKMDIDAFVEKYRMKYGIPKTAKKSLKDFGIFDARVITILTQKELAAIPNLSEKTALALKRASQDAFRGSLYQKVSTYKKNVTDNHFYLTTGSEKIDTLLKGGFRTRTLTEIAGEYRTGKTQICLTSAVTAQLPVDKGGLNSKVIYIDTTNSFTTEHYLSIGERFKIPQKELLKNLFIVQAEQMRYFNDAITRLPGYVQALDSRLIIIDSLIAPFEQEYTELNQQIYLQKLLQKLLGFLKRVAIGFNSVVLFTNHVKANYGINAQFYPHLITGGEAIAHASDVRIKLKKLLRNLRRMKIENCAWLPNEEVDFFITTRGIADTEEIVLKQEKKEIEETEETESPLVEGIKDVITKTARSK